MKKSKLTINPNIRLIEDTNQFLVEFDGCYIKLSKDLFFLLKYFHSENRSICPITQSILSKYEDPRKRLEYQLKNTFVFKQNNYKKKKFILYSYQIRLLNEKALVAVAKHFKIIHRLFESRTLLLAVLLVYLSLCVLWLSSFKIDMLIISLSSHRIYAYLLLLIIIKSIIHELGHASSLLYYENKPRGLFLIFYFVFPMLAVDVSPVRELKKHQKLYVLSSGILFEILTFLLAFLFFYFFEKDCIYIMVLFSLFSIASNLNPFLRTDGYWLLVAIINIQGSILNYIKEKQEFHIENKKAKLQNFVMKSFLIIFVCLFALAQLLLISIGVFLAFRYLGIVTT